MASRPRVSVSVLDPQLAFAPKLLYKKKSTPIEVRYIYLWTHMRPKLTSNTRTRNARPYNNRVPQPNATSDLRRAEGVTPYKKNPQKNKKSLDVSDKVCYNVIVTKQNNNRQPQGRKD